MLSYSLKYGCVRVVLVLGFVSGAALFSGCGESEEAAEEEQSKTSTEQEKQSESKSQDKSSKEAQGSMQWKNVSCPVDVQINAVAYGEGKFVAATGDDFADKKERDILVSTDGKTWRKQNYEGVRLLDITHGKGTFVAVGEDQTIMTSSDGNNWEKQHRGGGFHDLTYVVYGNGKFMAYAEYKRKLKKRLLLSSDGETWREQKTKTPDGMKDIAYGKNNFLVVGWEGGKGSRIGYSKGEVQTKNIKMKIATSAEGKKWEKHNTSKGFPLEAVTYVKNRFVACGKYGTTLTSKDGRRWQKRASATGKRITDIAYGKGQGILVAVGEEGRIEDKPTIMICDE